MFERIKISFDTPICEFVYKTLDSQSKKHKKYSKLTHSIMKGVVLSKIKDIRVKGTQRATQALMDVIKISPNEADGVYKATGISISRLGELIYRITKEYNLENLACFFGNLIYGGIIAPRNAYGIGVSMICFEDSNEKRDASDIFDQNYILPNAHARRISRAAGEIERFVSQGSGIVAICGELEYIFSKEMLFKYKNEPDIVFVLIETPKSPEKTKITDGAAAYPSHLLGSIDKLDNIMVVISEAEPDLDELKRTGKLVYKEREGNGAWRERKLRALASYGILCSELLSGALEGAEKSSSFGTPLFSFRRDLSLQSAKLCDRAASFLESNTWRVEGKGSVDFNAIKDILHTVPQELSELIRSPDLPIKMPNLFELLSVLQYFSTFARTSSVDLTIL